VTAYSHLFLLHAEGIVASTKPRVIRAPITGAVIALKADNGAHVAPGAPLAVMESLAGVTTTVVSPCDCYVGSSPLGIGSVRGQGAALLTLIPATAPLDAELLVPIATAQRMRAGDRVTLSFFDQSRPVKGRITRVALPNFPDAEAYLRTGRGLPDLTSVVTVEAETRLPISLVGRPVTARIDTLRSGF
jgi:hypothetical protein